MTMVPPAGLLVAAPVAGLATYCVSHMTLAKFTRGWNPYFALLGGFVPGLACTILATARPLLQLAVGREEWAGYIVLNISTYAALGWCYFHFVNMGIASLRIRILEELVEAGGEMPVEQLSRLYNDQDVIAMRLRRLRTGGHLVEREGRYRIGRQPFLFAARLFAVLHGLIFGANLPGGSQR